MNENIVKHITGHLVSLEENLKGRGREPEMSLKSLPELNKKIWGIHRKKLTLIGARTSQGKSAFALQIAHDLASQGHPVLFLSLEMVVEDMLERLFCNVREVDNYDLLSGNFEKYINDYVEFAAHCESVNLSITDFIGKTWQEIDSFLNKLSVKPAVIILDYIQTIAGLSNKSKEVIDEYIRKFREMAIRHNFAGIICSQINRTYVEEDNKEPQLHQLKGSGFLEEHSDMILLLHWAHKYDESKPREEYKLIVAKNRNGRTGYFKLRYIPQFYKFFDWEDISSRVMVEKQEEIKEWQE